MSTERPPDESWTEALRARATRGEWRCLSELLDDPAVRAEAAAEFPPGADALDVDDAVTRRGFLELLTASMAALAAPGCTRAPSERIVPYDRQPPEVTPGVAAHYATTMVLDGYGVGLLVESHEGRPTKVEGNPEHPASLGASGVFEQASVLGLYDPSRARALVRRGAPASFAALARALAEVRPGGEGLHLVLEPTSSPLLADLLARVRTRYPAAQVHFHAALPRTNAWQGARLAFGEPLEPRYDLRAADVIVALDADLLARGPMALVHARQFADRRRLRSAADAMNRLYVIEPGFTVTGTAADHRLGARRGDIARLAAALFAATAEGLPAAPPALTAIAAPWRAGGALALGADERRFVDAVAADLRAHAGRSLVVVGDAQSPEVHALAHAINAALGNAGRTVTMIPSPIVDAGGASHALTGLTTALSGGAVDTLVVLEGNVAYTAPADLDMARLLSRARRSVYLGLHENETARACEWFVPAAHYLEAWGDSRAGDGTVSLVQPLIAPLFEGRSAAELLALLAGETDTRPHALLRALWARTHATSSDGAFETFWEILLQRGVAPGTAFAPASLSAAPAFADAAGPIAALLGRAPAGGIELAFVPDARVHDGRFANNAWLLELPDPLTKLTWENAAVMSPATAAALGVGTDDVVELAVDGRSARAPALVLPGHAEHVVTLALGWGRQGSEALARGRGVNAYALRTSGAPYAAPGARVARVADAPRERLATTQGHWRMEGREIARTATLAEYRRDPRFAAAAHRPLTLYNLAPGGAQQWGMVIDLGLCTGCSACVVACQAENNVPVVGKPAVLKSREMHWLRIDRYFRGDARAPEVVHQPMLCQHCERAPCEYVCPVNATVHSPDGLNEQVYNRCIGTRFCSNNCPYKVRRFNFLHWQRDVPETVRMVMNPDVTVRARGVMEKCTFCVQRIREHEIDARIAGRPLRDGEFTTACAQACPTRAITFGRINDPNSEVSRARANERLYAVLDELGTEPRVRYLAAVRNPNPALERGGQEGPAR